MCQNAPDLRAGNLVEFVLGPRTAGRVTTFLRFASEEEGRRRKKRGRNPRTKNTCRGGRFGGSNDRGKTKIRKRS